MHSAYSDQLETKKSDVFVCGCNYSTAIYKNYLKVFSVKAGTLSTPASVACEKRRPEEMLELFTTRRRTN